MNKLMLLSLALSGLALLTACAPSAEKYSNEASAIDIQVSEKLQQAIANKDYRLFGLSGRRITAPGVPAKQMTEAIKLCGINLLPNSGDVLKNEQDKIKRQATYQLAEMFNQKMFIICQKYNS